MEYESNIDIIKEYGRMKGIKEEDLDDYVARTVSSWVSV